MYRNLIDDAKAILQRDPAAHSIFEVVFLYPGFHAIIFYRLAHWLHKNKSFFIARFVSQFARFITGIEIHPGAIIGTGLFIDHGAGVVIGETTQIGNNCTIYHGVTLGGTGKDKGKRHPTIGDNVLISAGAKILGPFKVGNNAKIGANAVVLCEVSENSTVVGVPGRTIKSEDGKLLSAIELDHINITDPISYEICRLNNRLTKLEHTIKGEK